MSGPAGGRRDRLLLTRSEGPLDVDPPGNRRLLPLLINDNLLHTRLQRQRQLLRAGPLRRQAPLDPGLGRSKHPELRLHPRRHLTALGQRVRHLQRQANLLNPSLSESPAARDWASLSSARKSVKNPPGQSDPPPSPPQPPSNAASYTDSLPP